MIRNFSIKKFLPYYNKNTKSFSSMCTNLGLYKFGIHNPEVIHHNLSYEEFQKDKPDCEVSDDHKWVDMDESDNEDFKPSHYVMLSYDGSHYDLISYKDNKKLVKLPEKVFKLFYQKCVVEKKFQGQFSKIKEFREFKE